MPDAHHISPLSASVLTTRLTRKKQPSKIDLEPLRWLLRVSDDEEGQARRRQRAFEAQHYPHVATLKVQGQNLRPGEYRILPSGRRVLMNDVDMQEVNLRPWVLDQQGVLRGDMTALGQAAFQRWMTAGLQEIELIPR